MAVAEDRRRIGSRLVILQVAAVVVFLTLGICFWVLQIIQGTKYVEMAENNHQRTLALRAPRGVMFDRNGKVLVENRNSFTISIIREHTKDMKRTVHLLSTVAGLDEKQVQQTVDRHRGEPGARQRDRGADRVRDRRIVSGNDGTTQSGASPATLRRRGACGARASRA